MRKKNAKTEQVLKRVGFVLRLTRALSKGAPELFERALELEDELTEALKGGAFKATNARACFELEGVDVVAPRGNVFGPWPPVSLEKKYWDEATVCVNLLYADRRFLKRSFKALLYAYPLFVQALKSEKWTWIKRPGEVKRYAAYAAKLTKKYARVRFEPFHYVTDHPLLGVPAVNVTGAGLLLTDVALPCPTWLSSSGKERFLRAYVELSVLTGLGFAGLLRL